MRHSLWLLLAAILSLPAQATTECRDIHDRDLRRGADPNQGRENI